MTPRIETFEMPVVLIRLDNPPGFAPVRSLLRYSSADPYAFSVTFFTGVDDQVEFVFARALLHRVVNKRRRRVGIGDVVISIGSLTLEDAEHPSRVVILELHSEFGYFKFIVPWDFAVQLLSRSFKLVHRGRELRHLKLERGLAELLRNAALMAGPACALPIPS
jgi:hypothetical protein